MINKNVDDKMINLILKNKEGKIKIIPGYDSEYGKAVLGKSRILWFIVP